jgi:thioredoxin-related protein
MLKKPVLIAVVVAFTLAAVGFGVTQTLQDNGGAGAHVSAPTMDENGMHVQDWIYQGNVSFPRLLRSAAADDKGLIVLIEQPGCHYCAEMHAVNFAKPAVTDFMRENFVVVQVNLRGSNQVVDFDGSRMTERELAGKWGVRGTPTTLVFQKNSQQVASNREAETFRLPGYVKPFYYVSAFKFLVSDAIKTQSFQDFIETEIAALEAKGGDPETW